MQFFSYDDIFEEALYLYENDPELSNNVSKIADYLKHKYGIDRTVNAIRKAISERLNNHYADKEIVEKSVRLAKEKQKQQDTNRIERKAFREYARVENAVEEYGKALAEQNRKFGERLGKLKLGRIKRKGNGVGVMQITDIHGNELIDLPHNKYDFNVLSRRMKKYVSESLDYFDFRGARKVLLAFTGDLLNSDRRLDELLNASTNRSKASILMVHILKQVILDIRDAGYEVDIISVLGNESRVNKEMTFSKEAFSDNYDFTIVAQLKQIFEFSGIKGIKFHQHDDIEAVVTIEDQKWLFKHNLDKSLDKQEKTQSTMGRHALKGDVIDFAIGGHIHACRMTDLSSRSSSMSGSNSYNENALNLMGRASHNCYYVTGKERFIQYIDLQYADNDGYDVVKELEAYNAKSVLKTKPHKVTFEVVI